MPQVSAWLQTLDQLQFAPLLQVFSVNSVLSLPFDRPAIG
jgi:hypothetical protein